MIRRFTLCRERTVAVIALAALSVICGRVRSDQRPYWGDAFALSEYNLEITDIYMEFRDKTGFVGHTVDLQDPHRDWRARLH